MLINTFKQIVDRSNDANKPTDVLYGEVTSLTPISIHVDSRFHLSGEPLVVPKGMVLEIGDSAILLRKAGGQEYVVIGVKP